MYKTYIAVLKTVKEVLKIRCIVQTMKYRPVCPTDYIAQISLRYFGMQDLFHAGSNLLKYIELV